MVKRQHQSQITLAPLMLAVLAACQVPQAQAQTEAERQVIKRASASPAPQSPRPGHGGSRTW